MSTFSRLAVSAFLVMLVLFPTATIAVSLFAIIFSVITNKKETV